MPKKREYREFDTTEDPTKKIKKVYGIMFIDIPVDVSYEEVNRAPGIHEKFVPKYQKNHIRIAYFICNTKEDKKKLIKHFAKLSLRAKSFEFKINDADAIKTIIKKLGGISDEMCKISDLYSTKRGKNKQERKGIAKEVNNKIKNIKFNASQILSKNYLHFKESFDYLTNDRKVTASAESDNSYYIRWLIIFYWLWFICCKVFQITIKRYRSFFSYFNNHRAKWLFNDIFKSSNIVKYLGFELFMQYFFLVDPFINEMNVIKPLSMKIQQVQCEKFDVIEY